MPGKEVNSAGGAGSERGSRDAPVANACRGESGSTGNDPVAAYSERYMREPWRLPDRYAEPPTLTLLVTVRNEESTIARCLESVKDVVDEVVMVDMGSTDRTVDIARSYGATVLSCSSRSDVFKARNVGLDHTTSDWVLFLEAYEELASEDAPRLAELIRDGRHEGYYVTEICLAREETDCAIANLSLRLWRNRPDYRFKGVPREHIVTDPGPRGESIGILGIRINRYAYLAKPGLHEDRTRLRALVRESEEYPEDLALKFEIGAGYLQLGDLEMALEFYKRTFADLPGGDTLNASRLIKNIALCLKSLDRHTEALKVLDDALEAYPDYPDLYYIKGLIHLEEGNMESAIADFEACASAGGSEALYRGQPGISTYMAAYRCAQSHLGRGDEAAAVEQYGKALEYNQQYAPALLDLGILLTRKEGPDVARRHIESLADLTSEAVLLTLSHIFERCGHYELCLGYLDALAGMDASPSQTSLLRGECLLNMKRFQEAIDEFNNVSLSSRFYAAACASKAICHLITGEYERAAAAIDLIKGIKDFAVVRAVYRFIIYTAIGKPTLLSIEESDADEAAGAVADLMRKLIALDELDVFEECIPVLSELGLSPGEVSLFLGKIYYDAGYNEIAAEELVHAYEAGSADGEAFLILGRMAFEAGYLEEAKTFFFEALDRGIEELGLFVSLGYTLIRQGELGAATDVLDAGAKKYPNAKLIAELRKSASALVCSTFTT